MGQKQVVGLPFWLKLTSHPAIMLLFVPLLIGCAVSCNVSRPVRSYEDDVHHSPSPTLPFAGQRLERVRADRGGPDGRHAAVGRSSSEHCLGSAGEEPVAGRELFECSAGLPCGISLQCIQAHTTHPKWWGLGRLGRNLSLWGSTHHCGACGDEGNIRKQRKENENDTDLGPDGRWGLHGANRGDESQVVPEVCPSGGRLSARRGGPNVGTVVSVAETHREPGHGPLRGFRDLRLLWSKSSESFEVPYVCPHIQRVRDEGITRSSKLQPVANLLQAFENVTVDVGRSGLSSTTSLRSNNRKTGEKLSHVLALDIQRRRSRKVSSGKQTEVEAGHGNQGGAPAARWICPEPPLGLHTWSSSTGRRFLADTTSVPCPHMDCGRISWHAPHSSGTTCLRAHAGRSQRHHTCRGDLQQHEGTGYSRAIKKEKTQVEERSKRWRRFKTFKGGKSRKRKRKGKQGHERPEMLFVEQWQWSLWCTCTWTEVPGSDSTSTQMHHLRFTGPSKQRVPEERPVKTCGEGQRENAGPKAEKSEHKPEAESSAEYTYTYETDEGEAEDGDEGQEDPEGKDPLLSQTLEEYYQKRVFIFIHHFAGPADPLTTAMRNEALKQGNRLKAYSVEKESGTGDLLADEPYNTHLRWAKRGYVDAFHAGFPCSTFSRLRFRRREGLPGPVRTRAEPYGRLTNSPAAQAECDRGTVMACRAIDMATAVGESKRVSSVGAIATLENPPPSNEPEHLSAWELPEMEKFRKVRPSQGVLFNTCRYEEDLELGKRHFKPQQFEGTLRGMQCLSLECTCGGPGNHESITGPERSKASATYPKALCEAYARLAVEHLKLMGKEEFLRSRMASLQNTTDVATARIVKREEPFGPDAVVKGETETKAREDRSRSRRRIRYPSLSPPTRREYKAATMSERPKSQARPPLKRRKRNLSPIEVKLKPAKDATSTPEAYWQGGEGKHEALRPSTAKDADPSLLEFVGGMKDPYKVVLPRATLMSLGLRIRAAWDTLERRHKDAHEVAEKYGTPDCEMKEHLVKEWKAALRKVLGAQAPPAVKIKPRWK